MKFDLTHNNLYAYETNGEIHNKTRDHKPEDQHDPHVMSLIQSVISLIQRVTENETYYTKRQLKQARIARNLLHALGNPTIEDLRTVLRINTIKNCPVISEDLAIMKRVYGPDPAPIKGKTTRQKPSMVVHDVVAIPPELIKTQKLVKLCMDTMFINEMSYLTSISKRIMYRTAQWVTDRTMHWYKSAFEQIL